MIYIKKSLKKSIKTF